jgi:hypothetical protein
LNFGTIEFDWKKRFVVIAIHNASGDVIPNFQFSLPFDQLQFRATQSPNTLEKCVGSQNILHQIAPRMVAKLVLIAITFFMIFLLSLLVE